MSARYVAVSNYACEWQPPSDGAMQQPRGNHLAIGERDVAVWRLRGDYCIPVQRTSTCTRTPVQQSVIIIGNPSYGRNTVSWKEYRLGWNTNQSVGRNANS